MPDPETGKRRRKWHSFQGTKCQAEVERARIVTQITHSGYTEPTKTTVAQFLDRWLEHEAANVSPKTLERYGELARKNIAPLIGATTLAELKVETIDAAWTKALVSGRADGKGGLSPRTVGHMRRVLVMALNQAVRWEIIPKNPAALSTPPKVERKQMQAYGADSTAQLLDALRGKRAFIPILLAVTCGLRRGEIAALRWQSVNLDNRRIAIVASAEQTTEGVRIKETKSARSRRRSVRVVGGGVAPASRRAGGRSAASRGPGQRAVVRRGAGGRSAGEAPLPLRRVAPEPVEDRAGHDPLPRPAAQPRDADARGRRPSEGRVGTARPFHDRHHARLLQPRHAGHGRRCGRTG